MLSTITNPDTYHGGDPGNCPDCRGTGNNRGEADSGSCPHCYGSGSRRIDMTERADVARRLPAYTRVRFAYNGSKVCDGLTRDLPRYPNESSLERRITNLTTGFEFFVTADMQLDHFEIVEFDGRG